MIGNYAIVDWLRSFIVGETQSNSFAEVKRNLESRVDKLVYEYLNKPFNDSQVDFMRKYLASNNYLVTHDKNNHNYNIQHAYLTRMIFFELVEKSIIHIIFSKKVELQHLLEDFNRCCKDVMKEKYLPVQIDEEACKEFDFLNTTSALMLLLLRGTVEFIFFNIDGDLFSKIRQDCNLGCIEIYLDPGKFEGLGNSPVIDTKTLNELLLSLNLSKFINSSCRSEKIASHVFFERRDHYYYFLQCVPSQIFTLLSSFKTVFSSHEKAPEMIRSILECLNSMDDKAKSAVILSFIPSFLEKERDTSLMGLFKICLNTKFGI